MTWDSESNCDQWIAKIKTQKELQVLNTLGRQKGIPFDAVCPGERFKELKPPLSVLKQMGS
jgi:hypothetical protein